MELFRPHRGETMLKQFAKKIMKSMRRQLLKVDWIRREVDTYRFEQLQQLRKEKKDAHKELWAKHLCDSNAIRGAKTEKPRDREFDRFDSINWGGMK